MDYRNPIYNHLGTIDCEIQHPELGWIPFTASPDDPEKDAREIYALIVKNGNIAPAPEPDIKAARESAMNRIDLAAGAARQRYVSAGQLIEEEYRQAKFAVKAWRAAGSPIDAVPPEIVSGAEYSDITIEAAAIEIEQTAIAWEGVLSQIRDLRLTGKAAVKAAADDVIESVAQGYIKSLEAMAPVEEVAS